MKTILIAIACLSLTSCATIRNIPQTVGPPSQVQEDVTYLGRRAKQYISAENQVKIHNFATQLNTTANLDLSVLYALLPQTTGSITGDILLASAKTTLSLIVSIYGANNPTTLAYAHAIANGLLANF